MNENDRIDFLITKSYKRFAEFCNACHRYKYIGLCVGRAGVGKTESAKNFANWRLFEPYVESFWSAADTLPVQAVDSFAVYYMAEVVSRPKRLADQIRHTMDCFDEAIEQTLDAQTKKKRKLSDFKQHTKLILIDEAERLKLDTLEQLRDTFDRLDMTHTHGHAWSRKTPLTIRPTLLTYRLRP